MTGTSFRLLDARTGWQAAAAAGLDGLTDPAGIRLAGVVSLPGAVHLGDLARHLPPARAAWDRAGRVVVAGRDRLRTLDPCTGVLHEAEPAGRPAAVAADRDTLLVADRASRTVWLLRSAGRTPLLRSAGRTPLLRIPVPGRPRLVSFVPGGLIAVVTERPDRLLLAGLDGIVRRVRDLPGAGQAAELGPVRTARGEELLLSFRVQPGWRRLLRVDRATLALGPVDLGGLRAAPRPVRLTVTDDERWTISTPRGAAITVDGYGEPAGPAAGTGAGSRYATEGRLRTTALDSGVDDSTWHRVVIDADQPPGTWVEARAATVAGAEPDPETGWQRITTTEALIRQPPGRFLILELSLHGTGAATPLVRRVTAEFGRSTSLDRLPAVYRDDPEAADFTRRFLSLFDASLDQLDDVIEHAPLILHRPGLPPHAIGALAGLLGIRPDPAWPAGATARLLAAWPRIWPRLGTPAALRAAVQAVYDVDVLVDEPGRDRPWGAVGAAALGGVRLFGAGRSGMRLGSGRLGTGRLDERAGVIAAAYGSGAFRCVVHVPASLPDASRPGLAALVRSLLPGHVAVRIRYASPAMVVGRPWRVGVDTRLGRPAPGVLGGPERHAVILRRRGPLSAGASGGAGVTVGRRLFAGITSMVR
ncbi:hypothetical protein [Actinoplanes sp. NPDC023714]|uniref:hypothetical protein n=1 Tax=Actinoplanes sp. NPDC023714 TaxID=3154322 RepID=UPI0033E0993E